MTAWQTNKYLAQYAEPEVKLLDTFPEIFFKNVLIIPAYQEQTEFIDPYLNGQFTSLLIILVINQPDTDRDTAPQQALHDHVINNTHQLWHNEHLSLHQTTDPESAVLCISRYEDKLRIKENQGVGLARKVAADVALKLITAMRINSQWLATTDADATLPEDYFLQIEQSRGCSAQTFDYQHEANKGPVSQATQLYETSLRYYQAGLVWAGSPYAFHALGSAMAINCSDYAKVRGFPKRPGGEDFYLLNKLRKIGPIEHRANIVIKIQSRLSERVPFGTGPAVAKILHLEQPNYFRYYHPQVFSELKRCLAAMAQLKPTSDVEDWRKVFSENHFDWLYAQGLERIFIHQQHQNLTDETLGEHLMIWFDGLLTLRFIHFIRDQYHPNCYLVEALNNNPFYETIRG